MNWRLIAGGLLVIVILTVGVGAAYYTGVGPAPGGTDSNERLTEFPTETPTQSPSSSSKLTPTAASTSTPAFSFTIDAVEECGLTCRDVTVTLHNNQADTATGVTVYTRIFAGKDNTDSADLVWEGKEEIGSLEASAAHTATKRVELSLEDAQQIEGTGGWVTIVTTVKTDDRTDTFQDNEQVA